MKTYNHAFTVAFSVSGLTHPHGEDIADDQFYRALRARAEDLHRHGEFKEAVAGTRLSLVR